MRGSLACACFVFFVTLGARADEPRASAVELFAHGRALAAEGKCGEAIPFFLDTLKIEPSIGALLNLAECYEKMRDDARAYARFREAESLAREKSDDREGFARDRAAAIAARAPSLLEPSRPVHDAPVVVPPPASVVAVMPPAPAARDGAAQRTVGIVVTLAGAGTLGAGLVLGGLAIVQKNDAVALSTGPSRAAFDDARASAKTFADASTATIVTGAILAAAGLVVWITAPRARLSPTALGLALTF